MWPPLPVCLVWIHRRGCSLDVGWWSPWIGGRGSAATVRPSYCQRCPDSPTLNTPGSLPWPLSDVRRCVVALVMWWPVWCHHRRGWVWIGRRCRCAWYGSTGAAALSRCGLVAAARCRWVWIGRCGCRFVAGLSWLSSARFFAGCMCGNFHRCRRSDCLPAVAVGVVWCWTFWKKKL